MNNIETARQYLSTQKEFEKVFAERSYTMDWEKPYTEPAGQKGRKINYEQITVGTAGTVGKFNRETGYEAADINSTWVEKELTQDVGNALKMDAMDGDEAQGLEIVRVAKRYVRLNLTPAVDKYRFGNVVGASGVNKKVLVLTAENIIAEIDSAISTLYENGVQEDLVLHLATPVYNLLAENNNAKFRHEEGWGGSIDNKVLVYNGLLKAKIVPVPANLLGKSVNFILSAPTAVAAIVKHTTNTYFDRVAGYGDRKKEIDLGFYHDCWIIPSFEKAVFVHKAA